MQREYTDAGSIAVAAGIREKHADVAAGVIDEVAYGHLNNVVLLLEAFVCFQLCYALLPSLLIRFARSLRKGAPRYRIS